MSTFRQTRFYPDGTNRKIFYVIVPVAKMANDIERQAKTISRSEILNAIEGKIRDYQVT